MKCIHIVGQRDHGKTTLVIELVEAFQERGIRVGTIKHSSHSHDLDTKGKDSYRHRMAGAEPAAVVTPEWIGVFCRRTADVDFKTTLAPLFSDCALVLVEGNIDAVGVKKIEVWRSGLNTTPLANKRDDILAVISDDQPGCAVPVWPRGEPQTLVTQLLSLFE